MGKGRVAATLIHPAAARTTAVKAAAAAKKRIEKSNKASVSVR